jgi:acetyl-CoA acyltransferase
MSPAQLGGLPLKETVQRTGIDPKLVDEVFMGIVSAPAEGSNIAREALFDSGLDPSIPCTTINRYCASSLETAASIAAKIQAGQIQLGLSAGVESISSIRALFSNEATDFFQDIGKMKSKAKLLSHLAKFKMKYMTPQAPGIKEPTTGLSMGQSADLMAREFKIGRKEQDEFALLSHQNAQAAWDRGFYSKHVMSVATPSGKVISRDPDIRGDSTLEKMATLRPVFYKDGTITAANASPLTDGASAVMLASESRAKELGLEALGYIRGYAAAGIDIQKEALLIAPIYAIPKALKDAGLQWSDIDLFEIHEAFAAQVLATIKALEQNGTGKVDRSKLNVNGGSVAIGHPFGATGGRMILQTLEELRARGKRYGLISVCAAGGLGSVMIIEAA